MNDENAVAKLHQRIDDLESQLAFQENTIDELNQLVIQQSNELTTFKRHLQLLASRLSQVRDEQSGNTPIVDEKPPHY